MARTKNFYRRMYTLVELLAVVVISALLLAVALPGFSTMARGSNMTRSINELAGKIKGARAYAVTNNCCVALVFPRKGDASFPKANYLYRSFRPCVVYSTDDSAWIFDSWIEGENWTLLPAGIVMGEEAEDFGIYETTMSEYEQEIANCDLSDLGSSDPVKLKYALIFKPNGQLLDSANTIQLRLMDGVPPGSAGGVPTATSNPRVMRPLRVNGMNCAIEYADPQIPAPK